MKKNYFKFGILFFIFIISCTKGIDNVPISSFTNGEMNETTLDSKSSVKAASCPACGLSYCQGTCYQSKVKNTAPNAYKLFNMNQNLSLDEWYRVELCLRGMIGRDILIKSFTDKNKKLNLINTSDSECIDTRTGNTISLPIENLEHIFVENLFHIYQHNYYGSYNDSYGVNVEFEAKSYFYISDCIYSCGPSVYPAPDFGSEEVTDRYMAWAEDCRYCFESGYNMGIMDTDYIDFITYLDNANNYNEYYNIHADTRMIMSDALFNLFNNAGGLNPDWSI